MTLVLIECDDCLESKPMTEFYRREGNPNKLRNKCKVCTCRRANERYWANPEENRKKLRQRYTKAKIKLAKDNPEYAIYISAVPRLVKKKLTMQTFYALLQSQNNQCASCGDDFTDVVAKIFVDHDHTCCPKENTCGKCTRGLLCGNCNLGLGHYKDSTDRLEKAMEYLKRWENRDK